MPEQFSIEKDFALYLDRTDTLSKFRSRFYIPEETLYVDGNSLGLFSKDAERSVLRFINEWKTLGIQGCSDNQSIIHSFIHSII